MEKLQTQNKKKSSIIGTAITVMFLTIAVNLFTPKSTVSDADIEKAMSKTNEELPMQIDEYMRLDSIRILSPKVLNYYMTANILKEEANIDTMEKYITPSLLENIRLHPDLKIFRKSKVTWKYIFNDLNGDFFYNYIITPDMYQ